MKSFMSSFYQLLTPTIYRLPFLATFLNTILFFLSWNLAHFQEILPESQESEFFLNTGGTAHFGLVAGAPAQTAHPPVVPRRRPAHPG